jgi:pyridoxamine 5'-phosphate oxidase
MTPPQRPLRAEDLVPDPLAQFARWYADARDREVPQYDAVALATSSPKGAPSLRMVLLKAYDERGFAFFTNSGSRKAIELETNPRAALLFHWQPLGRQVRIEGPVARVERGEVEHYARTRTRQAQLSALASPQSRPVPGREWLVERVRELERQHAGNELPVGADWGGFRLSPEAYEFWQHDPDRLHDRFRYLPAVGGGWTMERLGP